MVEQRPEEPLVPKQVIIIAHSQRLSGEDKKALEAAGLVVVRVEDPASVRMLSSERLPFDSNDMLRAAMKGLLAVSYKRDEAQAAAWKALCKLVMPEEPQ